MKKVLFAVALLTVGSLAHASPCTDAADAKKLAGAARNSFVQKCERESKSTCATQAADKKLAGAAKNSFIQKCERDSGTAPK